MEGNLKILTYNIWFEDLLIVERTKSLIILIHKMKPDVICLQEVRPDVFQVLKTNLKEYDYVYPDSLETSYGSVIFSKHPILQCLTYPFHKSKMGRNLPMIKIAFKGIEVIVATTHFESLFRKDKPNEEKVNQIKATEQVLDKMYAKTGNVVLGLDTNLLAHEEAHFFSRETWSDAWITAGRDDQSKFTYDGRRNVYLMLKNIPYRSRLDRIMYQTKDLKLSGFEMISTEGMDMEEPSDHFGLLATFTKS